MTHDPIIDEVRHIRDENAKKHHFDAESMGREFMAQQGKSGHRIVRLKRKKPLRIAAANAK